MSLPPKFAACFGGGSGLPKERSLQVQRWGALNDQIKLALDLDAMRALLHRLVAAGMPQAQAECFFAQAEALAGLLGTENNRIHHV